MKHLKLLTIIGVLVMGLQATSSQAQVMNEACLPDCFNDPFMGPFMVTLEICPGTFVNVEYGFRHACNIWYDYYIGDKITPGPGTSSIDFYNCVYSVGGMNAFLQLVSEQLIIVNPAGFPPLANNQCETNWRVLKGSCWKGDIILTGPPSAAGGQSGGSAVPTNGPNYIDFIIPCTTSDCCLERFTVCLDQNGDRIITNTGYLPPEFPDCDGQNDPWSMGTIFECIPVCGSIYNR